jgi:hypothetical protein
MPRFQKELKVYRANKTGTGCASSFKNSYQEEGKFAGWSTFLTMAKQDPETKDVKAAKFEWKQGVVVSLGENDIGEILSVLYGFQKEAGYKGNLYHQTDSATKNIKFAQADNENGYVLSVQGKDSSGNQIGPFFHTMSFGEGLLLKIFLEESVRKIYS